MTDQPIRRHANGSIDTAFYMARGRVCRAEAFAATPGWLRRTLRRLIRARSVPAVGTARPDQARRSLGEPITT